MQLLRLTQQYLSGISSGWPLSDVKPDYFIGKVGADVV